MHLVLNRNKKVIQKVNFQEIQRYHGIQNVRRFYINNNTKTINHQNNHFHVHLQPFNQKISNLISNQFK